MYTYKLYFFVLYLLSLRWAFSTSVPVVETQKTNVTFDLSKLKEHGSAEVTFDKFKFKETTFTTPDTKVVDKVVYDSADVWVSSRDGNKVLKKVVATHWNDIPQLLHLVVSTGGTSESLENKYYKKDKAQFTDIQPDKYNELNANLKKPRAKHLNEWYPMDFAKPEVHSGTAKVQKDLDDGVWKHRYTLLHGSVSVVKEGTDNIWTHDIHKLNSVQKLEFGNNNFLLTLGVGTEKKYYYKSGASATWTALDSESAFLTKANEFKSDYFPTKLEYDLLGPPNKDHFHVKMGQFTGNYNQLTLNVYREYYLGNVKYKGTSLWSGLKDTRVLYLKMDLLYHEVKTLQFFYSVASTGPFPDKKVAYFFKDTDGAFKQVLTKDEFSVHEKKVKAAINKTTPFVYNEAWPSQPKPMDLKNFYLGDFEVSKEDLTKGVTKQTLKPKVVSPMNGLNFNGVVLWPTVRPEVTKPSVKEVVIISKDTLPQLVHLKATAVQVPARGSTGTTTNPTEFNLYFQKVGENYNKLQNDSAFEQLRTNLISGTQKPDLFFHLDLNLEKQNNSVYALSKKYEDGVTIKVVEPKPHIRVTKLFSYSHDIWVRPLSRVDHVLKKYELYSCDNKKLLKLYIAEFDDRHHITHEYFEKRDTNVAWTSFYRANFDDKLRELKDTANLSPLELDVSVKPTTDYRVQVNPLSGNKTKLVLEPVQRKKITSVKHRTDVFFTSVENNRAYKVELYLEEYAVKFVKVFVWKDVPHCSPLLTEEKRFKDVTASSTTWGNANFDEKLREFETTTSTVPFTYSPDWVLPSMTLDPKTSHRFYFQSSDHTEGLVTTTTYTPKEGTVVNNVLYDGSKVWPANTDGSGDTSKKLVHLKVLSKNDMVQLLHVKNALVAAPNTTEDLYYKKEMDTYVKLDTVEKFNELKNTLSQPDKYVDENVKLDLSSTEETSTKLFEKETTLEDGVEKTVVVVKAGKLFQVSASPPLWESRDGSYVTRLERYVLDLTQFLVLHITKPTGEKETKYFEKPIQTSPPPPEPARDSSGGGGGRQEQGRQQHVEQQQQESQVQVPGPPAAPTTPSFSALDGSNAFFLKLNEAKARVEHDEVPLDVSAYTNSEKFEVKRVTEGTATLFKVYPKKAHWVTSLVNTSGVNLWTKEAQGERLVEAFLYVHNTTLKFVKAVVWPNNRTDASHDKLFHFKLENGALVKKTAEEFTTELKELTKVPPTPLSTEKYPPPEPTPYFFHKLYLSDTVDTNLFDFTESTAGAYKLKNYAVKQHKFVNAVETQHGLLWKAEDNQDHMKSTHFAVTENSALARLTVSVNSQPSDLFFKFEDDKWHNLDNKTYDVLYAKAGLSSS